MTGAKTIEAMKAKRKEDLKELKLLMRLDADTPIHPRLLDDDNNERIIPSSDT